MCKTILQIQNGENPWFVKELQTGYVILGWNQHFYGYSLFICKRHAVELFDLDIPFRTAFLQEMVTVAEAVKRAFQADKINYECLGNGEAYFSENGGGFGRLRQSRKRTCMVAAKGNYVG